MSVRTSCSAPGYRNVTERNANTSGSSGRGAGTAGEAMATSAPSTSCTRSADTSPRGTIMNIIVAIITDMKICMR